MSLPYLLVMKKLICKILGHQYFYNFGWMPNKCWCKRCGGKWKTVPNPNYIPGKTSPLDQDLEIWVEDNSLTVTYTSTKDEDEKYKDVINGLSDNVQKSIDEKIIKNILEEIYKNGKYNR
jgi:hypothetical protein